MDDDQDMEPEQGSESMGREPSPTGRPGTAGPPTTSLSAQGSEPGDTPSPASRYDFNQKLLNNNVIFELISIILRNLGGGSRPPSPGGPPLPPRPSLPPFPAHMFSGFADRFVYNFFINISCIRPNHSTTQILIDSIFAASPTDGVANIF